jgi:hypothetical protein
VNRNGVTYVTVTAANFSFTPDDNGIHVTTLTAADKDGGTGSIGKPSSALTEARPRHRGGVNVKQTERLN